MRSGEQVFDVEGGGGTPNWYPPGMDRRYGHIQIYLTQPTLLLYYLVELEGRWSVFLSWGRLRSLGK